MPAEIQPQAYASKVGDRYVLEKMQQLGSDLGGEQSGHVIFLNHHTTGDGILTSLQLIAAMLVSGKPLSELAQLMDIFPQKLINVDVSSKPDLSSLTHVLAAIRDVESALGDEGRVLVRYSGTQDMCRVMVEGPSDELTVKYCEQIVDAVKAAIGKTTSSRGTHQLGSDRMQETKIPDKIRRGVLSGSVYRDGRKAFGNKAAQPASRAPGLGRPVSAVAASEYLLRSREALARPSHLLCKGPAELYGKLEHDRQHADYHHVNQNLHPGGADAEKKEDRPATAGRQSKEPPTTPLAAPFHRV